MAKPKRGSLGLLMGRLAVGSMAGAISAVAGPSIAAAAAQAPAAELSELSLGNFFTAGWDEPWAKRPHPGGAPDLTLLRVQSNLLLYSLRTDFFYERTANSSKDRSVQFINQLFEYSLNRRLMLAAIGNYQWIDGRREPDRDGAGFGGLARLQLFDLKDASYALNFRVAAPNDGIGERQTLSSFSLAGWHDLTPVGLNRMGLYWHVQAETWAGPHVSGTRQNDLTYDLTLAKTWTRPDAALGNVSTFLEAYAKSDIDGRSRGHFVATLTPGFRFNVHHHHVFMVGVDLPASAPRPYDQILRSTYIYSF